MLLHRTAEGERPSCVFPRPMRRRWEGYARAGCSFPAGSKRGGVRAIRHRAKHRVNMINYKTK